MNPVDPLLYDLPLPLTRVYFPMGYPVEVATNSESIATAACRAWSCYPRLSSDAPVHFRIAVSDEKSSLARQTPVTRGHRHIISIIGGRSNFAVCDLREGFAYASLTNDVASDIERVTRDFLETGAYLMLAARHFALIHASCISLKSRAALLCGDSGAGKTCLAYALARRGWTFVSGDTVQIPRHTADCAVIGRPFSIRFRDTAAHLFPELAGYSAASGPNRKTDVEICTKDLEIDTALQAEAACLIFLDRAVGSMSASLTDVSANEASSYFENMLFYGDEDLRAQQRKALARLLRLRVWRLRYGSFDAAEAILRQMIERR